jgi:hypothetical protein
LVRAIDPAVGADHLVGFHLLAFESDLAPFLEEALSLVWAIYDLQGAILVDVTVNLAFLYLQAALVFTWYNCLRASILYVFFHLI